MMMALTRKKKTPKKPKLRLTLAFQIEYEADSEQYGTDDIVEMIAMDKAAATENPLHAMRALMLSSKDGHWYVDVKPIEVNIKDKIRKRKGTNIT